MPQRTPINLSHGQAGSCSWGWVLGGQLPVNSALVDVTVKASLWKSKLYVV